MMLLMTQKERFFVKGFRAVDSCSPLFFGGGGAWNVSIKVTWSEASVPEYYANAGHNPISVLTLVNLTMFRIPIEACFRPPRLFHLRSNLQKKYHTRILKLAVSYPFVKLHRYLTYLGLLQSSTTKQPSSSDPSINLIRRIYHHVLGFWSRKRRCLYW